MSTSLLVMTPFVLLSIVSLLCFVGCVLDVSGLPGEEGPPVFKYSDDTVLTGESDRLLAYWRLNDVPDPNAVDQTAVNSKNAAANGKYKSQPFDADPVYNSAKAPGTLNFGQGGLLQGDLQSPFTAGSTPQTSIFVDGGYVSVPWHSSLAPSEAEGFTLEAWVNVGWGKDPADTADRAVVVSLEASGASFRGFAIIAAVDQTWHAFVGTSSGIGIASGGKAVPGTDDHHLVATYETGTLKLYVNGVQAGMASATYLPTTGASTTPDAPSRLYIGAGGPHVAEPKVPFVGNLQCVALYRGAFSDADVLNHFKKGTAT